MALINFKSYFYFSDMDDSENIHLLPDQVVPCGSNGRLKILDCIKEGAYGCLYSGKFTFKDKSSDIVRTELV